MIKAILFDLDNTLLWDDKSVKEAFKATCMLAEKKYAIDPEVLEKHVRENARTLYASYQTYPFTQMIGINPFEGLWGNFADEGEDFRKMKEIVPAYRKEAWTKGLEDLGINDPEFGYKLAETFPVERKKNPYVYEETFKVLNQLKGNYQLLLLTNGSPDLQQTKLSITPELVPYFDHIVISGGFGSGKPDAAIFEHALELLSVKKDEALMVGDNLMTDILGASRVGIDSVWVNRHLIEKSEGMPTYEISNLEEILPIIKRINRS
ncbi:HAD family hydrolase [Virgibacillus necropolis]|uniref:Phosphoserine phosphatase n=1 Tax=Virgibacillus necropolis TaxID=163877 RepID=A0A221MED4_9BACI|nr:HAD family hydrolase [Virgibacillus necropolis]ASN06036.1 haloacid dehalogenase [Virgibacillus necropolis]